MKKLFSSLLILILFSVCIGSNASAQETEPDWPVYAVKAGDTLYSIAIRFGLTLDEIVEANAISDPNAISIGTKLILPGIDWVSGELKTSSMPLGESLRSLGRRYQVDEGIIARLSGFISPEQLAAGYPLMIPINDAQNWQSARYAVSAQTSLLELAVSNNNNPWSIKYANRLAGTWDLVAGDIIFLPGTDDPGPGALPSPISQVSFDGDSLIQGKTAVFRVAASGLPISLSGDYLDHDLNFFENGPGKYVAMQGIHVMAEPGQYMLTLKGQAEDGASFNFNQKVLLSSGNYSYEKLEVDDSFLDQSTSDVENDFLLTLISDFTEVQYWQGVFDSPSPYIGLFNSFFGNRRSFNGSEFIYYHGGLDYKGGLGVEIFAPAGGKVVFASPLTIRGNATIIDHGLGVYSGYFHQSEIYVEAGDFVTSGQVIGLVGNTGRSTGPHLHWEIWVGQIQVDPLDWLYSVFP